MNLRNLTWEEEVDIKLKEITRMRLELRIHLRKDKELRQLQSFKRDMSYQFHFQNEYLRENYNLNLLETIPEIDMNLEEINRLDNEVDELSEKILISSEKESEICDKLFHMKRDLQTFVEQHVQEDYDEEDNYDQQD